MKRAYFQYCLNWFLSAIACICIAACTHAPNQLSGGGSDTEVSGKIFAADGTAETGVTIALIAESYDPAFDGNLPSKMFDTTDTSGAYHFDSLNKGIYNIQAAHPIDGTKLLINSIAVDSGKNRIVPDETLKKTATLKIVLPDSLLNASGIITMPGTLLSKSFANSNGIFEMDSVPQGTLSSIQFKKTKTDSTVLFRNVIIASSDTIVLNPFNTVSGRVVAIDGQGVAGALVALIPAAYNPAFDAALPSKFLVTSNNVGGYDFYNIEQGIYAIYAASPVDGTKSLIDSVIIGPDQLTRLPDDTLKKTATLIVSLPDSVATYSGYLFIPGTFLWKSVQINARSVKFDSVPQGTLSSIVFQKTQMDSAVVLFRNVIIASSDTISLSPWAAWLHSAKIVLNTTASGANITQTVFNFPVLVRLDLTNFVFSQAKQKGEDIRFLRSDNSLIPFQIDQWDSTNASASIWVKLDTILGNTSQNFKMLWGNPSAKTNSNPTAVFDTVNAFQGVWHLGESGGTIQKDATPNHFDGTPVEMSGSNDVTGLIGRAQDFDGSSNCVTVLNARNTRLDVQTDSFYTISAWVYARTLNKGLHVFLSKGSAQYGLMINKQDQWEFFGGLTGYGVDTTTTAQAAGNVWTLVTGVRKGLKQYLYINGALADSTLSAAATSVSLSNNLYDLVIGRQSDDQSQWFDGIIDEARVENKARSTDWVRLCYQNQRSDQIFVQIVPVK